MDPSLKPLNHFPGFCPILWFIQDQPINHYNGIGAKNQIIRVFFRDSSGFLIGQFLAVMNWISVERDLPFLKI
ncbi:hypothetical protein SDC9_163614 [bioreactor metagenome]|uniref:Uncharacterized protein n=1 Tax=bioreactor metagenome TaxID=1076179 RepID=A0A645FRC9_9ZZZZ